ncbi:hypothetical protein TIFTF001_029458 [Ficus carica]|uniref:Uncharacterized protein n=1 Tax=Ficus carica TaxID=3494 RepID=A0AA88DRX0_FICCA|nr:hypothetical protein TIFTF001_029458 [Ficus carica]
MKSKFSPNNADAATPSASLSSSSAGFFLAIAPSVTGSASPSSSRFRPPSIFVISDGGDRFGRDRRRWSYDEISGMAFEASRAIGALITAAPSKRNPIAGDLFASPGSPHAIKGCSPIERACSRGIVTGRPTTAAVSDLAVPEPPSSLPRPELVHVEDIRHGTEESSLDARPPLQSPIRQFRSRRRPCSRYLFVWRRYHRGCNPLSICNQLLTYRPSVTNWLLADDGDERTETCWQPVTSWLQFGNLLTTVVIDW